MKKTTKILAIITIMITVIFTACSVNTGESSQTAKDYATEKQQEVLDAFKDGDKAAIKKLMCKYVTDNDKELDKEIDDAFAAIDSKIKSVGDTKPGMTGDDDNKQYNAYTQKVVTESGKEYKISFDGWYKCKDDPDKEGIMLIKVIDTSKEIDPSKEDKENGIFNIGIKEQ
ncbi:MAG: DUF5104 domain-containing protein [Ruminococcus sp.]|nr:DUF5104 domain-containing protein [Ruminococcus sp.]